MAGKSYLAAVQRAACVNRALTVSLHPSDPHSRNAHACTARYAGCDRQVRAQSHDHDKAETAALSETAATAGRAAATATGPLMSNGRQAMTAFTAWQRRDRMWARVQIGCAVVTMVTLLCW